MEDVSEETRGATGTVFAAEHAAAAAASLIEVSDHSAYIPYAGAPFGGEGAVDVPPPPVVLKAQHGKKAVWAAKVIRHGGGGHDAIKRDLYGGASDITVKCISSQREIFRTQKICEAAALTGNPYSVKTYAFRRVIVSARALRDAFAPEHNTRTPTTWAAAAAASGAKERAMLGLLAQDSAVWMQRNVSAEARGFIAENVYKTAQAIANATPLEGATASAADDTDGDADAGGDVEAAGVTMLLFQEMEAMECSLDRPSKSADRAGLVVTDMLFHVCVSMASYTSRLGMRHGDIKPENILVRLVGGGKKEDGVAAQRWPNVIVTSGGKAYVPPSSRVHYCLGDFSASYIAEMDSVHGVEKRPVGVTYAYETLDVLFAFPEFTWVAMSTSGSGGDRQLWLYIASDGGRDMGYAYDMWCLAQTAIEMLLPSAAYKHTSPPAHQRWADGEKLEHLLSLLEGSILEGIRLREASGFVRDDRHAEAFTRSLFENGKARLRQVVWVAAVQEALGNGVAPSADAPRDDGDARVSCRWSPLARALERHKELIIEAAAPLHEKLSGRFYDDSWVWPTAERDFLSLMYAWQPEVRARFSRGAPQAEPSSPLLTAPPLMYYEKALAHEYMKRYATGETWLSKLRDRGVGGKTKVLRSNKGFRVYYTGDPAASTAASEK